MSSGTGTTSLDIYSGQDQSIKDTRGIWHKFRATHGTSGDVGGSSHAPMVCSVVEVALQRQSTGVGGSKKLELGTVAGWVTCAVHHPSYVMILSADRYQ